MVVLLVMSRLLFLKLVKSSLYEFAILGAMNMNGMEIGVIGKKRILERLLFLDLFVCVVADHHNGI